MKSVFVSGLFGALLATLPNVAAATEDGSSVVITSVLISPFYSSRDGSQAARDSSQESSNESASREQQAAFSNGEKVSGSRASSQEITAGVTDQTRADARLSTRTSVANSNDSRDASVGTTRASSHYAPRKLIVPWRARSEAASWLATRCATKPSALLRSILDGLRQQHMAAGDEVRSDRVLAMELIAEPTNQS